MKGMALLFLLAWLASTPAFAASKKDVRECNRSYGQYSEKAEKACRKVVDGYPKKPSTKEAAAEAWSFLGSFAREQGNRKEAIINYNRAILLLPNSNSQLFIRRGAIFMELNQYDKAIGDFKYTIRKFQAHTSGMPYRIKLEAYAYLGITYHKMGNHGAAVDNLVAGYRAVKPGRDFGIMLYFKDVYEFYGLDKEENVEAYKRGAYAPPQLARAGSSSSVEPSTGSDNQKRKSTPSPNDGLYRSTDPNFSMGDSSLDF